MSAHCPQDGGFIGAAGCTHPRHAHSPLVKKILATKHPEKLEAYLSRRALKEGFYADDPAGARIGFGTRLLDHIESVEHHPHDIDSRLKHLEFAVDAVRRPDAVEHDHRAIPGRTAYAKAFRNFGMLVIADTETGTVKQAFTFVPNRKGRLR